MTEYAPTRQEFDEVYRKLWDIFENCVLVYELMVVQHIRDLCDLPDSPAEIEQKEAAAFRDVTYLDGLLHHIHKLAATDFQALGEVWPKVLGALECYTEDYPALKNVRRLAHLLGIEIWAELPKQSGGRTQRFKSREEVLNWLHPYIEMCTKEIPPVHPSIEIVAGFMGRHPNTIRYHLHNPPDWDWPDWEAVLTDFSKIYPQVLCMLFGTAGPGFVI